MNKKRFSVVTVCFNAEKSIEATLRSVISQSIDLFEFIVIDGGSTDSTMAILEKYRSHIDILISESDGGIYNAMNKGANLASGDYIIYMNANDVFFNSEVLAKVDAEIGGHEYSLVYGDYILNIGSTQYYVSSNEDCKGVIVTSHQAIFCKTEMLRAIGFDENLILAADYNLVAHLWDAGLKLRVSSPICVMESIGFSSNRKGLIISEHFKINRRRHGFSFAFYKAMLTFSSMQFAIILSMLGLSQVRKNLRRFKGWKVL